MIGGGKGAFIGAIHRMAIGVDGQIELVAGAFSVDPEDSKETGKQLFLNPDRTYGSYDEMFEKESQLPEEERIDFVSIVTPNFVHFDPAAKALKHDIAVVLEKPMTLTVEEAFELRDVVNNTGIPFAVTNTYTGYPMVKEARDIIKRGDLGEIRKVYVEYPQGWLATKLEDSGQMQASWRTDPKRSGMSGAMGDIGTHAENIVEYVSGLHITEVCAMLNTVVKGRNLDDDGAAFLKFDNGATGLLSASQVLTGEENTLKFRIYGTKGGLEWKHNDPNSLTMRWAGSPVQTLRAGVDNEYLSGAASANMRTPSGHPEGFIEAFANIYTNFSRAVRNYKYGESFPDELMDFPGVEDGVRGMAFVKAMVESSDAGQRWVKIEA